MTPGTSSSSERKSRYAHMMFRVRNCREKSVVVSQCFCWDQCVFLKKYCRFSVHKFFHLCNGDKALPFVWTALRPVKFSYFDTNRTETKNTDFFFSPQIFFKDFTFKAVK